MHCRHGLMVRGWKSPRLEDEMKMITSQSSTERSCRTDKKKGLAYEQVWASINYERYRNAVKFKIRTTEKSLKTVDLYDSDHAVAKTRLSKVWPDAWVNMLLVEKSLNRSIGSLLEKDPITPEAGANLIVANLECILKLFLVRTAELKRDRVGEYLKEAETQFLSFPRGSADLIHAMMGNNASGFFAHLEREQLATITAVTQ